MTDSNPNINPVNPYYGGPPKPIINWSWDPKHTSIELIIMLTMENFGMYYAEIDLYKLGLDQPAADKVRDDIFKLMNLITAIENGATKDGGNVQQGDLDKLISILKDLFGKDGDLADLMKKLQESGKDGGTAVDMVKAIEADLNQAFGSQYPDLKNFVEDAINGKLDAKQLGEALKALQQFSANYYAANHTTDGTTGGTNYLSTWYTDGQSGQAGLQGLSTMFTEQVQQDTQELNSFDQTGQQMNQIGNQLKQAIVNNQKSQ